MDTWCRPVRTKSGLTVYGGAARNVRISASGGMDKIIMKAAIRAAEDVLQMADDAIRKNLRIRRVK